MSVIFKDDGADEANGKGEKEELRAEGEELRCLGCSICRKKTEVGSDSSKRSSPAKGRQSKTDGRHQVHENTLTKCKKR